MRFCVLGSGSKGNCTLIASGTTTLLIDAGFSGVEITKRLAHVGIDPAGINALLVTHEHRDHVHGVGVLARRLRLAVYANEGTHRAAEPLVGAIAQRREFGTGEGFRIDDLEVHPFRVSHDTVDPVGFVVTDGKCSVGYCTDTGKVTRLMAHRLQGCHGLILEANHDPDMLRDGPYPLYLQQRVRSNQGHLANSEAGQLLSELAGNDLRHVVLAHLSEMNNRPKLALETVQQQLGAAPPRFTLSVAEQTKPHGIIELT